MHDVGAKKKKKKKGQQYSGKGREKKKVNKGAEGHPKELGWGTVGTELTGTDSLLAHASRSRDVLTPRASPPYLIPEVTT